MTFTSSALTPSRNKRSAFRFSVSGLRYFAALSCALLVCGQLHASRLKDLTLIEGGRDSQRRPRRLTAAALKHAADWIEPFRRQWEQRFTNLDAHLARLKKET